MFTSNRISRSTLRLTARLQPHLVHVVSARSSSAVKPAKIVQIHSLTSKQIHRSCYRLQLANNFSSNSRTVSIQIDQKIKSNADNWKVLLSIYEMDGGKFDLRNWASLFNRLKNLSGNDMERMKNDNTFKTMLASLEQQLLIDVKEAAKGKGNSDVQPVANILHALAKLGIRNAPFLELVEEEPKWIFANGDPQAIANIAWACATLQYNAPAFFQMLDKQAAHLVNEGNPQTIANTAWACATLQYKAPAFFQMLDKQAARLVNQGTPQNIANTAWACATLQYQAPAFFQMLDKQAAYLVNEGTPQNIANTAWACATLQCDAPFFFQMLNKQAAQLVNKGNPQDIAHMAWACATLQYDVPNLLFEIDSHSEKIVVSGTTQAISNTVLAFAELGYVPEALFGHLSSHLERFLKSADLQAISNVLWSIASLDIPHETEIIFQALWEKVALRKTSMLVDENLRQLAFAAVYARVSGRQLVVEIPTSLEKQMVESISKQREDTEGIRENEFSSLLSKIGFEHERQVTPFGDTKGSFLAIDFACKERKIAIEYDGDHHFLKNLSMGQVTVGRETGRTVAKRRLLQKLGWKVVNIPYMDNIELSKNSSAKQAKKDYLKKKLLGVGVHL